MQQGTKALNRHLNTDLQYLRDSLELHTDVPEVGTIMTNRTALLLTCSHPVTHGSWPYSPNVVEVGGLHLRSSKPLPSDMVSLLDSATEGAILVSFGSALSP